MNKIVIRVEPERRQWWKKTISGLMPEHDVVLWDEDEYRKEEIAYAIVWAPPEGGLAGLPNLRCVVSVAAGITHIMDDPTYPRHVPIIRTTSSGQRQRMSEYIALHVLRIHRRQPEIEEASKAGKWNELIVPIASEIQLGVMGMGNLGAAAARTLISLGYRVKGWSRRGRAVAGIDVYKAEHLNEFLDGIQILISILPATPETNNIIGQQTLARLPKGAWIINAGRGSQIHDSDLLAALDRGHLAGAVLDVFRTEPLPSDNPFWHHPKILITSHTASFIDPPIGGQIIADNLKAFIAGRSVPDLVDIEQGY